MPGPADPLRTRFARFLVARRARRPRAAAVDRLEPRTLLSAVEISEFMAINGHTLADQDNEYSDWIEVHNTTNTPVDLAGWHLTDNPDNLAKWTFPSISLDPDGYLVVFASEKDRTATGPGTQLHTNFKLSGDGEYLALVEPDGATKATEFAPYPPQEADVSYGTGPAGPVVVPLVPTAADAKYLIP